MEDGNLAVLVDAKTEYTKQLVNILKSNIYFIFLEIFETCKEECKVNKIPKKVFVEFQQKMKDIPSWNNEVINSHCETIIKHSRCDWIDELITAVFVSHTRILTSINFSKTKGKIDLNIPKTNHFIHKCFVDVARYFWKNSYLFDENVNKFDYQKNRRESELLIETSINETIRRELPVKNILRKYLQNDEPEPEPEPSADNSVKTMVLKELENCSNEKLNKLMVLLDSTKNVSFDDTVIESVKELTCETLSEVPVETLDTVPADVPAAVPVETLDSVPVETLDSVPVETLDSVPVETLDAVPADVPVDVPVVTLDETPVDVPVVTLDAVPADVPVAVPVETPVVNLDDVPVETPVVNLDDVPVDVPVEFANTSLEKTDLELEPVEINNQEFVLNLEPQLPADDSFSIKTTSNIDEEVIKIKTKSKPRVEVNLQDAFPELSESNQEVKEITVNLDDTEPNDLEKLDIKELNFDSLVDIEPKKGNRNYSFFE